MNFLYFLRHTDIRKGFYFPFNKVTFYKLFSYDLNYREEKRRINTLSKVKEIQSLHSIIFSYDCKCTVFLFTTKSDFTDDKFV